MAISNGMAGLGASRSWMAKTDKALRILRPLR